MSKCCTNKETLVDWSRPVEWSYGNITRITKIASLKYNTGYRLVWLEDAKDDLPYLVDKYGRYIGPNDEPAEPGDARVRNVKAKPYEEHRVYLKYEGRMWYLLGVYDNLDDAKKMQCRHSKSGGQIHISSTVLDN